MSDSESLSLERLGQRHPNLPYLVLAIFVLIVLNWSIVELFVYLLIFPIVAGLILWTEQNYPGTDFERLQGDDVIRFFEYLIALPLGGLLIGLIWLIYRAMSSGSFSAAGAAATGAGAIATIFLVFITRRYAHQTREMAKGMREQVQIQERRVRLDQRPDVMEKLENDFLPLYNDVSKVRRRMGGTRRILLNGKDYQAFPYIPTEFEDPFSVPRLLRGPIDINPSDAADFYRTYEEYRQVYGTAVHELKQLILSELDDPPDDPDTLQEYATLALQIDTDTFGRTSWDSVKDDIIPLRDEIPELIDELARLKYELHSDGGELAFGLQEELTNVLEEFEIDESELNPDSVKTEWSDDETGQLGVYIGDLPIRPQFADTGVEEGEDGNDDGDAGT